MDDRHVESATSKDGKDDRQGIATRVGRRQYPDCRMDVLRKSHGRTGQRHRHLDARGQGAGRSECHLRLMAARRSRMSRHADALIFTFKTGGDSFSMTAPHRAVVYRETRRQGGAVCGRSGHHQRVVQAHRRRDRRNRQARRQGNRRSAKMTVSPDGKTMTIEVDDKLHGTKATYIAVKQ